MGWATEWLPDGRMLLTGPELLRREPDGTMVRHADLGEVAGGGWAEIVVNANGNVYLNSINFDFMGGARPRTRRGSPRWSRPTDRRAGSPTASRSRTGW